MGVFISKTFSITRAQMAQSDFLKYHKTNWVICFKFVFLNFVNFCYNLQFESLTFGSDLNQTNFFLVEKNLFQLEHKSSK